MKTSPKIRPATWDDEQKIGALMALAFANDPFVRWLLPDPDIYIQNSYRHVGRSSGASFDAGTAYIIGDNAGASVWLPPNHKISRDHETANQKPADLPVFPDEFEKLIEKSASYCPKTPHWYLSFIVVDPARRGLGYGSSLMEHGLKICDRDGLPAYLESTNAANLSLYQRFGFKVLAEVSVGNSPARYPMLRPAKMPAP